MTDYPMDVVSDDVELAPGGGGIGMPPPLSPSVCTGSTIMSSLQLAAKSVTTKAKMNGSFFSVFFIVFSV